MEAAEWSSQNRGQGVFHSSVKLAPSRLSWHRLIKPVRRKRGGKKSHLCAKFGRSQHSLTLSLPGLKDSIHCGRGKSKPSPLVSSMYFTSLKSNQPKENSEAQSK